MANYKETTGTGTSWKRARQVIINNNYSGTKNIMFFEEDIAELGGNVFRTDAGLVTTTFDAEAIIPLRDPETGERTGNVISQALVYQALYSLYLDLAESRDVTAQNPVPTIPVSGTAV